MRENATKSSFLFPYIFVQPDCVNLYFKLGLLIKHNSLFE